MSNFSFKIKKECTRTKARAGEIKTFHGKISTPVFMPVGTLGSVKTLSPQELLDINTEIILANAYHLYLRPGVDVINKLGGLHKFMNWSGPILTDSGGYQVFSLARLRKITENGVEFSSHIDGSKHFFTPEKVIKIQCDLGADIIMTFDDCAHYPVNKNYTKQAMERTHIWASRCKKEFQKISNKSKKTAENQVLFGIVQGGMYPDLREESVKVLTELDFPGYAIGGLSVGEKKELTFKMLEIQEKILPKEKPRYLMGVGEPKDLLESIERGIDMFDCVLSTRIARNGACWTEKGRINLRNAKYKKDSNPIQKGCPCYACSNFSKAYISHLVKTGEVLGIRLTTLHNLYFILNLMKEARKSIKEDRFLHFKKEFLSRWEK